MLTNLVLATALLATFLLAISIIDIRTFRIPDVLNLAMGLTGLGAAIVLERPIADHLIGVFVGYLMIVGVNAGYRRWRRRDGIGMGDAKFMASAGAWLGWYPLPFVTLIGTALALAMVAGARLAGASLRADSRIFFGPFLAAGVAVTWVAMNYRDLLASSGGVR